MTNDMMNERVRELRAEASIAQRGQLHAPRLVRVAVDRLRAPRRSR